MTKKILPYVIAGALALGSFGCGKSDKLEYNNMVFEKNIQVEGCANPVDRLKISFKDSSTLEIYDVDRDGNPDGNRAFGLEAVNFNDKISVYPDFYRNTIKQIKNKE